MFVHKIIKIQALYRQALIKECRNSLMKLKNSIFALSGTTSFDNKTENIAKLHYTPQNRAINVPFKFYK